MQIGRKQNVMQVGLVYGTQLILLIFTDLEPQ
jgi:hypothetical protein